MQEYCGDVLNFKTYSKSYKNKTRIENDCENWVIFKDVHDPVVDRTTWEKGKYEDEFVKAVMGHSRQTVELERQKKQKEYNSLLSRDKEIDRLFDQMYEDNVAGKISDERFSKMTKQYEDEQSGLAGRIKTLRTELDKESRRTVGTDMFIATVRKYTRARKLTSSMLNEMIDHIEVHQAKKVNGVYVQKLTIHYNCIGSIEIPDVSSLPEPDVLIQTRKGVAVGYSQAQMAG